MIKKIATFAGAAAMLLSAATPAMAGWWWGGSDDTTNTAVVNNAATATANTGSNDQTNKAYGGGSWFWGHGGSAKVKDNAILTGDAWAEANAVTIANTQVGCGCEQDGDVSNTAIVNNYSAAAANSGDNTQYNKAKTYGGWAGVYNNGVVTGNAGAEADAWSVVNTDLSGFAF